MVLYRNGLRAAAKRQPLCSRRQRRLYVYRVATGRGQRCPANGIVYHLGAKRPLPFRSGLSLFGHAFQDACLRQPVQQRLHERPEAERLRTRTIQLQHDRRYERCNAQQRGRDGFRLQHVRHHRHRRGAKHQYPRLGIRTGQQNRSFGLQPQLCGARHVHLRHRPPALWLGFCRHGGLPLVERRRD